MKTRTLQDKRVKLSALNRHTAGCRIAFVNKFHRVRTCRRALAVYVTMTAENVPSLRALLKTSVRRERRLALGEGAVFYSQRQAADGNSQVRRKQDMGRFHDVTTSTIDRGNSIFRGSDTVTSLHDRR